MVPSLRARLPMVSFHQKDMAVSENGIYHGIYPSDSHFMLWGSWWLTMINRWILRSHIFRQYGNYWGLQCSPFPYTEIYGVTDHRYGSTWKIVSRIVSGGHCGMYKPRVRYYGYRCSGIFLPLYNGNSPQKSWGSIIWAFSGPENLPICCHSYVKNCRGVWISWLDGEWPMEGFWYPLLI